MDTAGSACICDEAGKILVHRWCTCIGVGCELGTPVEGGTRRCRGLRQGVAEAPNSGDPNRHAGSCMVTPRTEHKFTHAAHNYGTSSWYSLSHMISKGYSSVAFCRPHGLHKRRSWQSWGSTAQRLNSSALLAASSTARRVCRDFNAHAPLLSSPFHPSPTNSLPRPAPPHRSLPPQPFLFALRFVPV